MKIAPLILGSGHAGQAIARSLSILNLVEPKLGIEPAVWLPRGTSLAEARAALPHPVLVIANPHGLHAEAILEAERAGFEAILCEKPACVTTEQVAHLRKVKTPTAVYHGYRQMWGIQSIKRMVEAGEFGKILSVEGTYWQSSTADRALKPGPRGWKDDPKLSGNYDTFLDLGSHWVDAASFLLGSAPLRMSGWRSFVNSPSPHRDSHCQLEMEFPSSARGFVSISKTVHGATNDFGITVIGEKRAATWKFMSPDEIVIGEGRDRRVHTRKDSELGSRQWPFHGAGWLEGYIEISARLLKSVVHGEAANYPRLTENLDVLNAMFATKWQS